MNAILKNLAALVAVLALTTAALAAKPVGPIKIVPPQNGFNGGNNGMHNGNGNGNFVKKPVITIGNQVQNHLTPQHTPVPKFLPVNGTVSGQKLQQLNPTFVNNNYHTQFGVKKTFGFCYQGLQHNHWSYKCWVPTYGCHVYWDPCLTCYYYWCVPDNCWYPTSYCPYGVYVW